MANEAMDHTNPTSLPVPISTSTSNSNHLKQKRARSQLSCRPCRQGKLKCNRAHEPACDQCIKRNRESSCLYLPPPAKNKPAQNVKGRIRQLESLVVDLMNNSNHNGSEEKKHSDNGLSTQADGTAPFSEPTPPSEGDISPQSGTERKQQRGVTPPDDGDSAAPLFGQMMISKNEISYVGEGHWGAILNSISDLKREFSDDEDDGEDDEDTPETTEPVTMGWNSVPMGGVQPHASTGLGFMLGDSTTVTKDHLISNIPEKKITDRLLSLWFNSPDPFKPIIHAPTFQDEYRQFWKTPEDTPIMWLGLLYSIMSLAVSFGLRGCNPSTPQAQKILNDVNRYHSLAASAAVLADFTRPKEHTIECLILYAAGLRSSNAFVNVWIMIGLIVRLALRMGYHRDPCHYPAISVFQGEMRRRTWAMISMIDVLISFQLGLPSMVKTIQFDTQPPQNLLDRDFNVHTKVLPPGRGIDELTPSSYTRAKLRITRIFADASDLSHATVPPAYEEIIALDAALEEAKASIPPLLQMPDITELVTDPAEQLMCRFNLDLLYLKTKLTLHRRCQLTPFAQLTPAEQCMGIGRSRKSCTEASLQVLSHHQTIYTASQPGGQLESVKWYMGSISTHDFLLAAMIICLELSSQIHDPNFSPNQVQGFQCPRRGAMMQALEKSQKIWSEASGRRKAVVRFSAAASREKDEHTFDETEKASRAMAVMIRKVRENFGAAAMSGLGTNLQTSDCWTGPPKDDVPDGQGVTAAHVWDNIHGTPILLDPNTGMADQPFANDGEFLSHPTKMEPETTPIINPLNMTYTTSPNTQTEQPLNPSNDEFDEMDFALIGDMLDPTLNATLDWEMWDAEIAKNPTSPFPPVPDASSDDPQHPNNLRMSNALTGGSGTIDSTSQHQHQYQQQYFSDPYLAGNVLMPGGTGPMSLENSFAGRGFEVNGFAGTEEFGEGGGVEQDLMLLEDVSFDLGVADYNRNGMYPASKEDWMEWRRRKSGAVSR